MREGWRMQSVKCEEIIKRLRTLKIPAAYSHFNAPPSVPFVVYLIPETERYGSDSKNMLKRSTVRIELYTDHKDTALEDKLSALFSELSLTAMKTICQTSSCIRIHSNLK